MVDVRIAERHKLHEDGIKHEGIKWIEGID